MLAILPNQRTTFSDIKGYLLYSEDELALLDRDGKAVCGLGVYNAIGAPPECIYETKEEAEFFR